MTDVLPENPNEDLQDVPPTVLASNERLPNQSPRGDTDLNIAAIASTIRAELSLQFCPSVVAEATRLALEQLQLDVRTRGFARPINHYLELARDEYAFEKISHDLVAVLFSIYRDLDIAEVARQNAMLKIWQHMKNGGAAQTFSFYIKQGVWCANDECRKKGRRAAVMQKVIELSLVKEEEDASRAAEMQDEIRRVENAVRKLKPEDQKIIKLSLEGISREEIAKTAGVTEGAIFARLRRIREQLHHILANETKSNGC